jgi:hypothetical protein
MSQDRSFLFRLQQAGIGRGWRRRATVLCPIVRFPPMTPPPAHPFCRVKIRASGSVMLHCKHEGQHQG